MDKVGFLLGETSLGKGCLRAQRYTATVPAYVFTLNWDIHFP